MVKFWIYAVILVILAALGMVVGAANDAKVTFDFLIVSVEVSLAGVFVMGSLFGLLIGLYVAVVCSLKFWRKAAHVKSELKASQKETEKAQKALTETQNI